MTEEKKTEEQLRHDVRREFSFSEETDKENIDKALQMKKDRYTATQQKKQAQEELEKVKNDPNKGQVKEPKGTQEANTPNYSLKDIRSLGKVHDDDVDRVEKFAKAEGIPIAEALKNDDMKAILANREEKRKTADATNTGTSRRSSSKVSDETLLEQFDKGELPEDTDRLAQARIAQKKSMSKGLNK